MIKCPKSTHRIHKFRYEDKMYLADIDRCNVLEINPVVWDVLYLCSSCNNAELVQRLKGKYNESIIHEVLDELEEIEKQGLIFGEPDRFPESLGRNEKMKIFIPQGTTSWISDIKRLSAGTNIALHNLVKSLSKYADVYFAGKEEREVAEGLYEVPMSISEMVSSPFRFREQRYDGILAHHLEDTQLLELFRCTDVPIILQIYAPRGHGGKAINSILRHYAVMRHFDAFITPSTSVLKFYSRFLPDISCFHAIPLGVDSEQFRPMNKESAKAEIAKLLDNKQILEKPVIGFLSRFQPEKGAGIYIKLAEMIPRAIFLVAGAWRAKYSLRDLPGNLVYCGFHHRDKLPLIYNAFDIYCFLSMSGEETFGLALLEAMSCGVPPVVPDFDGLPEVVGDAGIVVPAENFGNDVASLASYVSPYELSKSVNFLLNNNSERISLGEKARKRALSFSWDESAKRIVNLFKELKARRGAYRKVNLHVVFTPYFDVVREEINFRSILINLTDRTENPLMSDEGYPQSVAEGLALSLLKRHTFHEVEIILKHVCGDDRKAKNIISRIIGFMDALS